MYDERIQNNSYSWDWELTNVVSQVEKEQASRILVTFSFLLYMLVFYVIIEL